MNEDGGWIDIRARAYHLKVGDPFVEAGEVDAYSLCQLVHLVRSVVEQRSLSRHCTRAQTTRTSR